jgi:hypothetical protein
VRPPHRFCRESLPITTSIAHRRFVPNFAIGRSMQCEKGNFRVVNVATLNTSFRIDIRNERSISKPMASTALVVGLTSIAG